MSQEVSAAGPDALGSAEPMGMDDGLGGGSDQSKPAQVAETAKDQVGGVADQARSEARDLAGELKSQVRSQTYEQRDRTVDRLHSLSDELDRLASGEPAADGTATEVVRQLSDRTRQVAHYLQQREPGDLLEEVRAFGRRRPGLFIASCVVLGVAVGRVTRSAVDDAKESGGTEASPWAQGTPGTSGTTMGRSTEDVYAGDVPASAGLAPAGGELVEESFLATGGAPVVRRGEFSDAPLIEGDPSQGPVT
jgi:hypothetical protein